MKKEKYMILGFDEDGTNVLFNYDDKIVLIKSTLPKALLVSYLNIEPRLINKELRDSILDKARLHGRLRRAYSADGIHFQRNYFSLQNGKTICKWISVKEDIPYDLPKDKKNVHS